MAHSLAHGLDGSWVAPDWPPLTLDEADRVLRRFPAARGAERLISFSPRPFSAGSVVATKNNSPAGRVFLKRHARAVRDREGLLEEHRLMQYLAGQTNSSLVQAPLADVDGQTAIVDGPWTYEVHPLARGLDLYEHAVSWSPFLKSTHARAAGRAMATLHRAAEGYAAPARKPRQLVTSFTIFASQDPIAALEHYLTPRPHLKQYMEVRRSSELMLRLHLPLAGKLKPWLKYLKPLWAHNDLHASNLTWSESGPKAEVCGVIDFGLADLTNAVHDLATAIERNAIEWLRMDEVGAGLVHLDQLTALLDGYEEHSPLSYEQAGALAAMLPLVHCEFALSETDYFLSVLHSQEKAYLAYEGYFEAHARWFTVGEGRRLIEHLERWADSHALSSGGTKR